MSGVREAAYNTLVQPQLEYAAAIWDPHTKEKTEQIEKDQRRAARWTTCNFEEWQVFRPCLKLWVGVLLSRDARTHASAYSTRLSITWSQYLSQITSDPTPVRPVAAILWHSSKFTQGGTFINIPFFHWQSFSGMPSQKALSARQALTYSRLKLASCSTSSLKIPSIGCF